MERLKAFQQQRQCTFAHYLHSSMERLKGPFRRAIDAIVYDLHSSMERLKVYEVELEKVN